MASLESVDFLLISHSPVNADALPLDWTFILYLTVNVIVQLVLANKGFFIEGRLILLDCDVLLRKK
jgi:hypothetical protein